MNVSHNGQEAGFVFREAATADELNTLLKLRYDVYLESRLEKFVKPNEYGIDLDPWDFHARHFGLFREDGDRQTPVGYFRVVQDSRSETAALTEEVARRYPGLETLGQTVPSHLFPLLSYWPEPEAIETKIAEVHALGERMVEPGRFALAKEYRFAGLAAFIIESAIAIYFYAWPFQHAIASCSTSQYMFYRRYGWNPLIGCSPAAIAHEESTDQCVYGSTRTVPAMTALKLSRMADEFLRDGCTVHQPRRTQPATKAA